RLLRRGHAWRSLSKVVLQRPRHPERRKIGLGRKFISFSSDLHWLAGIRTDILHPSGGPMAHTLNQRIETIEQAMLELLLKSLGVYEGMLCSIAQRAIDHPGPHQGKDAET